MRIIGITGTLGAGKGTIVEYLVNNHCFVHYSVRSFLTDIIKERELPVNRDSMVSVANELREKHAPSYIAEQLYQLAEKSGQDCVIESLRTKGEILALNSKGNFSLFAVDANPSIRYERIVGRGSETDSIGFETFVSNEAREMKSDDPNKQNLSECIQMADYIFQNNGSVDELYKKVEEALNVIA